MIVVSNASPIILLDNIGRLDILHKLYKTIIIPEAVNREIFNQSKNKSEKPAWIIIKFISDKTKADYLKNTLDSGESEVIILAEELKADLLLLDDYEARKTAKAMKLKITGIAGVLLDSKEIGLIDSVCDEMEKLIQCNYRISKELYQLILKEADEL